MRDQRINISHVTDTAISIGNARDVVNAPAGGLAIEELQKLAAFLKNVESAAPELPLTKSARSNLIARLRALEKEMQRPPDKERRWLRQAMNGIYDILIGATGNATYAGLLETAKYFMLL